MSRALWERRVGALAQVRAADPAHPVLSRDAEHHLRRVLRARPGEEVVVFDGRGAWSLARVAEDGLERVSEVVVDDAPAPVTLYFAPPRGERAEWAVAKATELGVTHLVPLLASRLTGRLDGEAGARALARWRRIADEAAAQCRRTHDLVIESPCPIEAVPAGVAVCDVAAGPPSDFRGVRAVCVGPEGGWAPGEWDPSRRRLSLGETVLRSETAAVVASALMALDAASAGFSLGGERYGQ